MEYSNMSAIVTGGAGGLGGATSRRLIDLGFSVVIFEPEGERAAALADELGPRAFAVRGDHESDNDVRNAIAVARRLGKLILNVNSAGIAIPTPATATVDGVAHDMGLFRGMLDMHLMGPFNVSRLCAAAFARNEPDTEGQRGLIINTSSTAAFDGQAGQTAYAAAKAAIAGMTLAMARDLAPIGVRVCAIAPGPFLTPRLAAALADVQASLVQNVAFPKRFGRGEEFAELVVAILRTTFLNGQTIRIDGAMSTPLTPLHLPAQS